jgi:hypothetical protein
LHLTADELPPAWRFPDGVLPADLVRAHRYSHIARTVPPRFVSKAGYRLEHSLAPAAFECMHAKFTQLLVLQNLARLDGQLLTEQLAVHREIALCSPQPQSQLDTMTTAEQAVTVTYAVLAVIGRHCVDMSTVTGEPHAVECCPTEDADRDAAYDWLVRHWPAVRNLPSRNCPFPARAPDKTDTGQWQLCSKRFLKEQVGVGTYKTRAGAGFRLAPLPRSVWTLLGIDMAEYATWYGSPAASGFGVLQKAIACCAPCDGTGDDVQCVRQNNVWRCVSSQTAGTPPHRRMEAPLDVCQVDRAEHKVVVEPGLTIEQVAVAPPTGWSAVETAAA